MRRFAPLLLLLVLAACAGGRMGGAGAPRTAWSDHAQARAWTEATRAALDAEGAPLLQGAYADIGAFCPRYAEAEPAVKRDFWVVIVSEIAALESALEPARVSPGSVAAGSRRGLLQISSGAAERYACEANGVALLEAPVNLACGVKILAATSARDGVVTGWGGDGWRGAARYWEALRKPEALARIQARANAQAFCAPERRRRPGA